MQRPTSITACALTKLKADPEYAWFMDANRAVISQALRN